MGKTNGGGKPTKSERWSDEEVSTLVAVWGDNEIQQQLDGTTRNAKVFSKLSDCLRSAGYERTPAQCREKLKAMKKEYKKVKDHNRNQTGGKRKECPFYEELDAVLGCRHSIEPAILFDTATALSATQEQEDDDETPLPDDDDEDMPSDGVGDDVDDDDNDNAVVSLSTSMTSQASSTASDSLTVTATSSHMTSDKETLGTSRDTEGPPRKKAKNTSKLEATIDTLVTSFIRQQEASMKSMFQWQDRQAQMEAEREERQRKDDREHDQQMFRMFGQLIGQLNQTQQQPNRNVQYNPDGTSYYNM